jgi:PKD repeat protein
MSSCKKPPKAKFVFNKQKAGLVSFKNISVGVVDDYIWLFGDGESSTEVSPTHRYLAPGTYTVTLRAINKQGEGSFQDQVTIDAGEKEDLSGHPIFSDADGYMIATNVFSFSLDSPLSYNNVRGEALAAFYDTTNFFIPVGVVSANGQRLESKDNNTYFYSSPDSGYYFKERVNWRADGNAQFPLVIETYNSAFPAMSAIQENPEIDRTASYVLSLSSPASNADSVLWQILDRDDNLLLERSTEALLGSFQFSSESLDTLTAGPAKVRVLGYNFESRIIDEKKIYFINESSVEAEVLIK